MESQEFDVLVVGTGASGLTAAVTAAKAGLKVLIVEKEAYFGGTTATSGGALWVPGNPHSVKSGVKDSVESARAYIASETGSHFDAERVDAFLESAKHMVDFLERETEVKFYGMRYPDYHSNHPESSIVRSIGTVDYQASKLGPQVKYLKEMLPQTLFLGLAVGSGVEMKQFMNAGRSLSGLTFVLKKLACHIRDLVRYGRSEQVVRGRALVARLARTAFDLGIPMWLSSPAKDLIVTNGRVVGAEIETPRGVIKIMARRGVVLACGGYPGDKERRNATYPHLVSGKKDHATPTPVGNTGDGIRFGERVGGHFVTAVVNPAAWMPVSRIPGREGSAGVWPHIVDRQKPGFIAVTRKGKRFVDESGSYHDFVPPLIRACEGEKEVCCYLIADHRTVKRYGIGFVKPFPVPKEGHIRSGYLLRGRTLAELAANARIDAAALERTVKEFNRDARNGVDPQFGRGSTVYDHYQGDDEHQPNPNLGPVEHGPFYAVKIIPGEIGTFAGLKTDKFARVVSVNGLPISGLYAVGNDAANVLGGAYPGAGSTLGPGMTFGYIAGRHLAGQIVQASTKNGAAVAA